MGVSIVLKSNKCKKNQVTNRKCPENLPLFGIKIPCIYIVKEAESKNEKNFILVLIR